MNTIQARIKHAGSSITYAREVVTEAKTDEWVKQFLNKWTDFKVHSDSGWYKREQGVHRRDIVGETTDNEEAGFVFMFTKKMM